MGLRGGTQVRTESPCVLQDFVPFGAAAQKQTLKVKMYYAIPNLRGLIWSLRGLIRGEGDKQLNILTE